MGIRAADCAQHCNCPYVLSQWATDKVGESALAAIPLDDCSADEVLVEIAAALRLTDVEAFLKLR